MRKLITPPVHTVGLFVLAAPFEVEQNVIYRVHAIRTFEELHRREIDVFESYYQPFELTERIYQEDLTIGASIITLINQDGDYYYVPNTFIESYPGMSGIKYERKLVLLDLGPLPESVDIDYIIPSLQDVIMKGVGVQEDKAEIKMSTVPMATAVTHDEHVQMEMTRRASIQQYVPLEVQLLEKTNQVNTLLEQNEQLMSVILAHKNELTKK